MSDMATLQRLGQEFDGRAWMARELYAAASDWLATRYPGALIVNEFSIGSWGAALIDIAAITENEIIGIEIKGEGDSATRIPLQAAIYSKAATRMFILPCPSLEAKCLKAIPKAWGVLTVAYGVVERGEGSEYARKQEPTRLCVAPGQLVQCLWSDEIDRAASRLGHTFGRKLYREAKAADLAENIPLARLIPEVCLTLRERKWIGKNVRWAPQIVGAA
jgi:hypothetical protein